MFEKTKLVVELQILLDIGYSVGFVAALLTIFNFFLPINTAKARVWHAAYIVVVCVVISYSTFLSSKQSRLNSIAIAADTLLAERDMEYTHRGFVLAVFSFLEKNKDLFPDNYDRAVQLCNEFKCNSPQMRSNDIVTLSSSLAGLVRGIGTLSKTQ